MRGTGPASIQLPASEMLFGWRFAGGSIVARLTLLSSEYVYQKVFSGRAWFVGPSH